MELAGDLEAGVALREVEDLVADDGERLGAEEGVDAARAALGVDGEGVVRVDAGVVEGLVRGDALDLAGGTADVDGGGRLVAFLSVGQKVSSYWPMTPWASVADLGGGADVVELEALAVGALGVEGVHVVVAEGVVLPGDVGPGGEGGEGALEFARGRLPASSSLIPSRDTCRRVPPLVTMLSLTFPPRCFAGGFCAFSEESEHLLVEHVRLDVDDEPAHLRLRLAPPPRTLRKTSFPGNSSAAAARSSVGPFSMPPFSSHSTTSSQ